MITKLLHSSAITRLGITCFILLIACIPTLLSAQFYYADDYYADEYYDDSGYCAYESNVQDAFAAQNPAPAAPSNIRGRQNLWGEDGYGEDENTNPSDPLPLGDGWVLLLFAAITAGVIFIQQRKRKQPMKQLSTHNAHKILLLLGFLFLAGQSFAWKPIMIGHRGCRMGVENTEDAFLNAIKVYGFQALECDVKMTKDLVPVCWHDDNLSKGPNNYAIATTNLATLQAEKLTQTRNGTTYTGYICTLDRYMEICRDYNVIPVVELKYTTGITSTDMSNFSKIYAVIQKYGMEDRTIILGFESGLKHVRANYPELRCQHLINYIDQTKLVLAKDNGWEISSCYYYNSSNYVTQALVQQAKDYKLNVSLWTIDSEADYKKYAAYGANYVTSNDLKLKDIADLSGTDPNVSYGENSKTIYYRPSTTNFAKGYTNQTTKGNDSGWNNVWWMKNSRVSLSVHGSYKANIYLDYGNTKINSDLSTSRFIPIRIPDGYDGVIAYRLNSTTATEANYTTWKYASAGAGITNSNTVPKFTNTAQIPTPEKIPTDGKNLLCNKEGWWDVWYWAYYLPKNNGVSMYFANTGNWSDVKLLTGKDIYTTATNAQKTISGTQLAYFDLNANEYGYLQYGFIGNGYTEESKAVWNETMIVPYVGGTESEWVYDGTSKHDNNKTEAAQNSNSNKNRIANRVKFSNNYTGLQERMLRGVNLFTPGAANGAALSHTTINTYADLNHNLTIEAENGGSISGTTYKLTGTTSATQVPASVAANSMVTVTAAYTATTSLTATPQVGYSFNGWYIDGTKVSSNLTYTFNAANKAQKITAKFTAGAIKDVRAQAFLYNSSTSKWEWKNSNDGGTFSFTHSGGQVYNHTTVGYTNDITLTLDPATWTATPAEGYYFIGWWNNTKGIFTDNPWTMANPADYDESVTARFAPLYTQVINTTNNGGSVVVDYNNGQAALGSQNVLDVTITSAGTIKVLPNEPVKLKATPNAGYEFAGWWEGSTRISVSPEYIYNATSDKTITARFDEILVTEAGNFRLKYVEQTAQSLTVIKEDYSIYSDEIPKSAAGTETTVSMHIYNKIKEVNGEKVDGINNPEIILQQYDGSKWVDIEAYMVFGPLQITNNNGSVIKLPGRKNAGDGSSLDDLVIEGGIPAIMNDTDFPAEIKGCGVWNFIVKQDGTTATIDMTRTHRYEGNYYARAESTDGGYDYYNAIDLFTYSEYAFGCYGNTHDFTHYFCDNVPAGGNVKFTIACDNNSALAHPLLINNDRFADDEYTTDVYVNNVAGEPVLPAMASVRYSWDIVTNRLTRAYIGESKPKLANEYLIIDGATLASTDANYPYFYDNTNWVYSIDVDYKLDVKAQVKAKYNDKYQYFWGNESIGLAFVHSDGSDNTSLTYPVRIVYDFKEHRFSTIYKPTDIISGTIDLAIPVMILREHNDPATQIVFNSNADKVTAEGDGKYAYSYPAYGVLTFLEDKFATNVTTTNHYEKMFYWVSFPFDVCINDVVGLGEYENYWAVQYYNGPKRAEVGLPAEYPTAWEYIEKGDTLKANVGYVVCLNYRRLCNDYGYTAGQGRKVSLYFPSANPVSPADVKNQANVTVTLAEHPKGEKVAWNHWNWHLLGVPSYANPGFSTTQGDVPFFYQYWHPTDGYAAVASTEVDFYAMHSYMVQYAGEIEWSKIVNTAPSGLAAKKNSSTIDKTMLRLELQQAGATVDKTYVQLREEEGTLGFDLNLDLTKIINKGANIYSVVYGDQMAGNVVPAEEAIIPLGVVITKAGEYSFTLPSNTNGITVELIDYEHGTITNLVAMDYTVVMSTGTFDNRFALRMQPDKVTTGVENTILGSDNDQVHKLLIDGVLYLIKDGAMYDTQGHAIR